MARYRIPGNTTHISDHWAEHRARGSLGGTDFTDGYGTPMRAMADGVVVMVDSNPDGSGGRMITIRHDDGDSTEELHASRFIVTRGQRVNRGDVIGYSGGSGFGKDRYYGAHIHAHGVHANGVRFDVEPYCDLSSLAAATSYALIGGSEMDDNDRRWIQDQLRPIFDAVTPGQEGVKHDGVLYQQAKWAREAADRAEAQATAAARDSLRAADSVTPGIEGVKFDGELYALVKATGGASLTISAEQFEQLREQFATLSEGDLRAIGTAAAEAVEDRQRKRLALPLK